MTRCMHWFTGLQNSVIKLLSLTQKGADSVKAEAPLALLIGPPIPVFEIMRRSLNTMTSLVGSQ